MTLEANLGYKFKNKSLLGRALTGKAYALEEHQQKKECEDQEIFRTLGDAVLKGVLIDLLIKSGCSTRGEITSRKKSLEREERLAEVSKRIGIGSFLKLGKGEKNQNAQDEPYVLAETFEAVIGAIYLDGGFESSKRTIQKLFGIQITKR
jgi:ribonuclease-3